MFKCLICDIEVDDNIKGSILKHLSKHNIGIRAYYKKFKLEKPKQVAWNKGLYINDERVKKYTEKRNETISKNPYYLKPEFRKRCSENATKFFSNPEKRQQMSEIKKKQCSSKEYLNKLSDAIKNKYKNDPEYRRKNHEIITSKERRQKMMDGYKKLCDSGYLQTPEHKKYRRELNIKSVNKPGVKQKIGEASKRMWRSEGFVERRNKLMKIINQKPEVKKNRSIGRSKYVLPKQDKSTEVKLQNFLKELNIEFITHKYMKEIEHAYQCDIYVPEMNLVIEADGNYWHTLPGRQELDAIRTKELQEKGYKVIRIWEKEIRKMSLEDFRQRLSQN